MFRLRLPGKDKRHDEKKRCEEPAQHAFNSSALYMFFAGSPVTWEQSDSGDTTLAKLSMYLSKGSFVPPV